MDRRKFLSTLIGGVATAAAVRTFPFRVFSFPKQIAVGNWEGICFDLHPGPLQTPLIAPPFHGPVVVAIYRFGGGGFRLIEQISLAEAKAKYGYDWRPVWRPGYPKTQQAVNGVGVYTAPHAENTTGLIL